jgi:tetratricopeptide (TPR) repeat protein
MNRLEQLQGLLKNSPDEAFLVFALAKEHEKLEAHGQALAEYLRLRAAHPDYVGLYYHLGKLYEHLQHPTEAMAVYEAGLEVARAANDRHSFSELRQALDDLL